MFCIIHIILFAYIYIYIYIYITHLDIGNSFYQKSKLKKLENIDNESKKVIYKQKIIYNKIIYLGKYIYYFYFYFSRLLNDFLSMQTILYHKFIYNLCLCKELYICHKKSCNFSAIQQLSKLFGYHSLTITINHNFISKRERERGGRLRYFYAYTNIND